MKVLIIGGTGFLGYYATRELLASGHQISLLALPPSPASGLFPPEVDIHLENIDLLTDKQLDALMVGKDALIFAAGVDDRVTPKKPAYPFFYHHNVESTARIIGLARKAGVKRGVVLGSYFAYFERLWPEMKLSEHHPYIRSRVEQARAAISAGGAEMNISVVELPYIFGSMPGKTPLWKPLISYIHSGLPLLYPAGGTTCVTVHQVGQAIRGAVEKGEAGKFYPIGGENLTWVHLLGKISQLTGKPKKVITLPTGLVKVAAGIVRLLHSIQGKESGLEPVSFIDLQTRNTYINSEITRELLKYDEEDLDQALLETIQACN